MESNQLAHNCYYRRKDTGLIYFFPLLFAPFGGSLLGAEENFLSLILPFLVTIFLYASFFGAFFIEEIFCVLFILLDLLFVHAGIKAMPFFFASLRRWLLLRPIFYYKRGMKVVEFECQQNLGERQWFKQKKCNIFVGNAPCWAAKRTILITIHVSM